MRSAEVLQRPLDEDTGLADVSHDEVAAGGTGAGRAVRQLQQQAADRLASHRLRRGLPQTSASLSLVQADARESRPAAATRSSRIANAVAERYAQSQSYRDFLAAEAQRAIDEATAAAEIAARSAEAITAAQQKLIADLHLQSEAAHADSDAALEEAYLWPDADTRSFDPARSVASLPEGLAIERRSRERAKPVVVPSPAHQALKADPAEDLFAAASPAIDSQSAFHATAEYVAGSAQGLSVRLYGPTDDAATEWSYRATLAGAALRPAQIRVPGASDTRHAAVLQGGPLEEENQEEESLALDEEIAFRQTPVFDDPPTPVVPIPGNLLEFPRQLVATRKARPLLAEGPLRPAGESAESADPAVTQLRIFEVDPSQISSAPPVESMLPEWSSIHLDAPASILAASRYADFAPGRSTVLDDAAAAAAHQSEGQPDARSEPETAARTQLYLAPLSLRAMAAAVDLCMVLAAVVGFTAVAASVSGTVVLGESAAMAAFTIVAGTTAALFALYQVLFFTFSDCTPGMRYARIALCTFTDENPSRRAMRRRIPALALSVCPAALGLLWIWLDQDQLALHDRLTGMYQRSY